jgi:hypothetical protein
MNKQHFVFLPICIAASVMLGGCLGSESGDELDEEDVMTAAEPIAAKTALRTWWSGPREDNYTSGTVTGDNSAIAAGYSKVRVEGYGWNSQASGTVPLYLFFHSGRGDNFTASTSIGINSAYAAGYSYARVEAYVYPTQVNGTVPLYLFFHSGRGDNFTTAKQVGINSAYAAGYSYVRVEGYVFP